MACADRRFLSCVSRHNRQLSPRNTADEVSGEIKAQQNRRVKHTEAPVAEEERWREKSEGKTSPNRSDLMLTQLVDSAGLVFSARLIIHNTLPLETQDGFVCLFSKVEQLALHFRGPLT